MQSPQQVATPPGPAANQSRSGQPPMPATSSPVNPSLFSPSSLTSRPHGVSHSAVVLPVTRAVSATSDLQSSLASTSSASYSPVSATGMPSSSHSPGMSSSALSAASSLSPSPASSLYLYDRSLHSAHHPPHVVTHTHTQLPPAIRRFNPSSVLPSAGSTLALSRPAASTSAAAAAAASLQASLHISGLQVLDVVVCRPRGFVIKRGLLQTYIPSPQSSDASTSPTRGGTPSSGIADESTSPASGQLSASSAKSPNSPALPSPPATFSTPASLPAQSAPVPPSLSSSAASSSSSSVSSTASGVSSSAHFAVRPVLVKTFSSKSPTDEAITWLRFEYLAFQKLSIDVNRPLALVSHEEEGLCILYDDCGGSTIDRLQYDSGSRAADTPLLEVHDEKTGEGRTAGEGELVEPQPKSSPLLSPAGSPKPAIPNSISAAGSSLSMNLSPAHSQPSNPSTRILRSLTAILRLSRSLSSYLLRLHEQGVIYKAVRPSTIMYNEDDDRCVLLEYHASSLLSRERAVIDDLSEHSSDTSMLLYISPEQSGRMNRALDSRTDIYSLGIVMYQLLVGQPPFVSSDPMEVIHFHLAKACPDPLAVLRQRGGSIHELEAREKEALGWLSAIILKCVAKQAEDRYQSAAGLLSDLDYCYRLMLSHSEPPPILSPLSVSRSLPTSPSHAKAEHPTSDDSLSISAGSDSLSAAAPSMSPSLSPSASPVSSQPFSVGRMDVLSQFRISQKLYGREQQVRVLLDAFARISGDDVESVYGEWSDNHDSADENGSSRSHTPPADRAHSTTIINSLHRPPPPHSASTTSTPSPRPPPRPELVLIAGYSGIGKTSVVDEVQKPMVKKRGLFVRGKFDLYKRNHSVLLQAFQQLVMQLLTQDVEVWRAKLLAGLGEEGQVLVDVIPELEKLIGSQPAVAALSAGDAEKRFNRLFLSFVHVFSQREHPLILFIDDLQWSDSLSLQLFRALFTQQSAHLLLIGAYRDNETGPSHPLIKMITELQTENEDDAVNRIHSILLQPLALPHISALVKDSLGCPSSAASELAKFLLVRTQGNPFFVCSVLSSLHQDKLLTFDYGRGRWSWDMEQLRYANISSDVVDLLVGQIQRMDSRLQEVIKLAACIGNTFSLATLAIVAETTEEQATWELWQLAGSGMIIALHNQYDLFVLAEYFRLRQTDEHEPHHTSHAPLHQSQQLHKPHVPHHSGQHEVKPPSSHTQANIAQLTAAAAVDPVSVPSSSSSSSLVSSLIPSFNSKTVLFRFAHDRVQQAAASLIPAAERRHVHLKIGRLLLSHTAEDELDAAVIDIVGHFNTGGAHALLTDQREMRAIIGVEMRAGKKAKASTAYSSAVEYLSVAKQLLDRLQPLPDQQCTAPEEGQPVVAWHFEYEVSVEVHVNLCLYLLLSSDIEAATALTSEALKHINTVYDQVAILEVQQQIEIIRVNMIQATEIGLQSLKLLGYQLDTIEEVEALAKDSARVYEVLERIIAADELTDPYYLAVQRLLVNLTAPSFFHPGRVFSQIAHAMVRIASEQGINLQSGFSLSTYAHVLWGERQPALCYRFGREAMSLLDRYGSAAVATRAKVQTTFYGCIAQWMEPLRVTYIACFDNADLCNSQSDFQFVGYSLLYGVDQMLAAGEQLERVLARQREMIALFAKRKQAVIHCVHGMYISLGKIAGIIAPEADSAIVDGVLVSPAALVASFQAEKVFMFEFAQHAYTTMFNYYQRDFQLAAASGEQGWQMFLRQGHSGAAGLTFNTDLTLYYALTLLSLAPLVADNASLAAAGGAGDMGDSFDSVLAEANTSARRFDELEVLRQQIAGKSPLTPRSPHQQPVVNRSEAYRHLTVQVSGDHVAPLSASAILSKVAAIQKHIALWATHNPSAYANKHTLVDAERLRVFMFSHPHAQRMGPRFDLLHSTLKLYERSISLARMNGATHEEALANELAARFCLAVDLKREAEGFLRAAYWGYAKWGSQLKQQQMRTEFPHVFVHHEANLLSMQMKAAVGSHPTATQSTAPVTDTAATVRKQAAAGAGILPALRNGPAEDSHRSTSDQSSSLGSNRRHSLSDASGSQGDNGIERPSGASNELTKSPPPVVLSPPSSHHTIAPFSVPAASNPQSSAVSPTVSAAASSSSWDAVDMSAVMKACMAFSVETDLSKLTRSLLWLVIQTAGASRGTLLLKTGDQWAVELVVSVEDKDGTGAETTEDGHTKAIGSSMPLSMFNLVQSTHTAVLLSGNELKQGPFQRDAYLSAHRPKACLAVPILQQNKLTGLLYLQNDHTADSFTRTHLQILTVLTQQAALSIENARLYARLQQRTLELQANNEQLQVEVVQRQAAQDAMRVAKEAAEKAAETKSAFLSNMSHEIRTPMNAVLGASRLLLDTDLTQEQSSYLTMITNSGKLLLTIINDVLDFSRIESNNLELEYRRFSLMECVENACHLCFDMAARKQLDLAYTVDRHVPGYIYGDSSRLQQILLNLLSNACKFTQPAGQIVVTVSCRALDANTPAAEMLARAAAAHTLTHGHSPPQNGSNGRDGLGLAGSAAATKQRVVSSTPQPQPSRRLVGPSSAQPSSSSSSSAVSTVRGLLNRIPSQTHSATSSPTVATAGSSSSTPSPRHFIELHFSVRDTGLGMSEETQSRLFKSFSQGDSSVVRRFGGTGLGLAISKRLALAMHGEMWCESKVGEGSIFSFTIQTACATPAVSRRIMLPSSAVSGSGTVAQSVPAEPSPLGLSPLARLGASRAAVAAGGGVSSTGSPRGGDAGGLVLVSVKQHSLHRLSDVEVQRLQGKRVLLVSDLPASRAALENLLDSFDMSVTSLASLQQAAQHASSFGGSPMYHAVILDYKGCSSSPQQVQLVDGLIHAFVTSAHAAAARAGTTAQSIHPAVLMLTTRLAGASEGSVAGLELVKPSAVVGGKEGDDSSDDEKSRQQRATEPPTAQQSLTQDSGAVEDEGKDERTGEGSEQSVSSDEDDADTAAGEQDSNAHSLGTSHAFVGQMVLAKLSSLESHRQQRREERKRRIRISKADKVAKTADGTSASSGGSVHQPKLVQAAVADDAGTGGTSSQSLLSAASSAPAATLTPSTASTLMYPSASPSPPPSGHSSASPRSPSRAIFTSSQSISSPAPDMGGSAVVYGGGSGDYCLLELPRPYRQDDLLSTLAEHMPAAEGEVLPDGGRWGGRSVSAVSANGSEELLDSGGSQHDDDEAVQPGEQQQQPGRDAEAEQQLGNTQLQSAYNTVYAQREALSLSASSVRSSTGSGSDGSTGRGGDSVAGREVSSSAAPSTSPANALFGIPTVGSSLRREAHSSRASSHRSGRHTDSDKQQPRTQPAHSDTTQERSGQESIEPKAGTRAEPIRRRPATSIALSANGADESASKLEAPATSAPSTPTASAASPPSSPNPARASVSPGSVNGMSVQSPSLASRSLLKSSSRATPSRQSIQAIASSCPLSLLLAEDNPVNQKMMKMFLRKLGYEDVAIAVSGEEVLAVWAAKERDSGGGSGSDSGVFDVILMDVNMDGMDGIECTRQLRSRTTGQRVYIIAQTANANTESKHKCIDAGMDSFLPKPVILEELARQLKLARQQLDKRDRASTGRA